MFSKVFYQWKTLFSLKSSCVLNCNYVFTYTCYIWLFVIPFPSPSGYLIWILWNSLKSSESNFADRVLIFLQWVTHRFRVMPNDNLQKCRYLLFLGSYYVCLMQGLWNSYNILIIYIIHGNQKSKNRKEITHRKI